MGVCGLEVPFDALLITAGPEICSTAKCPLRILNGRGAQQVASAPDRTGFPVGLDPEKSWHYIELLGEWVSVVTRFPSDSDVTQHGPFFSDDAVARL